jgi:hypothetical protein
VKGKELIASRAWVLLTADGILIAGALRVSLQRYPEPRSNAGKGSRSHGILPIAWSQSGQLLAPLAAGEAVWIGLIAEAVESPLVVKIRFHPAGEAQSFEMSIRIAGPAAVVHVPTGSGGSSPIVREPLRAAHPKFQGFALSLGDRLAQSKAKWANIRFVDYDTFACQTGLPPPGALDPDAAYGGDWMP